MFCLTLQIIFFNIQCFGLSVSIHNMLSLGWWTKRNSLPSLYIPRQPFPPPLHHPLYLAPRPPSPASIIKTSLPLYAPPNTSLILPLPLFYTYPPSKTNTASLLPNPFPSTPPPLPTPPALSLGFINQWRREFRIKDNHKTSLFLSFVWIWISHKL